MRFLIGVFFMLCVLAGMLLLSQLGPIGIGVSIFGIPMISRIADRFFD
jgi:hypothetical protein